MEAAILSTCWRLGYRPTADAPSPLDWRPWHLLKQRVLSDDFVIEVWLRNGLRYGLLPNSTAYRSSSALSIPLTLPADTTAAQSLWERGDRTFSRRLAAAGIVERKTIADKGAPMKWHKAKAAWQLPDALKAEYNMLLQDTLYRPRHRGRGMVQGSTARAARGRGGVG